jgi:ATP/ADP translocase
MRPNWRSALPRIERDEVPLVLSLGLLHFIVVLAFTVARIARDGALLSRLSVAYLPYVSVGLAAWMLLAAHAFGWITRGASAARSLSQALLATG